MFRMQFLLVVFGLVGQVEGATVLARRATVLARIGAGGARFAGPTVKRVSTMTTALKPVAPRFGGAKAMFPFSNGITGVRSFLMPTTSANVLPFVTANTARGMIRAFSDPEIVAKMIEKKDKIIEHIQKVTVSPDLKWLFITNDEVVEAANKLLENRMRLYEAVAAFKETGAENSRAHGIFRFWCIISICLWCFCKAVGA